MEIRDRRGGFLWINNEVIDDYAPKIGGSALLVYIVLCRYANNATGEARPSQETLAKLCELSPRSIRRAISTLEHHKLIETEQLTVKGQWDRNVYYLLKISSPPTAKIGLPSPADTVGQTVGQTVGHHSTMNNTEQEEQELKLLNFSRAAEAPPLSRKKIYKGTQFPENFQPNETNKALAQELNVNLRVEWPKFRDYHRAKGTVFKDWHAAANNWIRRAHEYAKNGNGNGAHQLPPEREGRSLKERLYEQLGPPVDRSKEL
jgi:Helix-turn-helix domain